MNFFKQNIKRMLASAGVQINGDQPWDMQVLDERLYLKIFKHGSLGLGEAYMNGWWDVTALDQFFYKVLRAQLHSGLLNFPKYILDLWARLVNPQTFPRSTHNATHHYDIGNDLYKAMLDDHMVYTGAYWNENDDLNQAQKNKLDMVCRKLGLQAGQRVLDIGCGWGGFARYAAEKYGVSVVGITLSKDQVALGSERCKGLPVEIRLLDYRHIKGSYDHIVSLGMFEHVGYKNYRNYMEVVSRSLGSKGVFLLQTIGNNISQRVADPWINKYIFPNGLIPSIEQIGKSIEGLFVMEDWHNFGTHYDKTLMAWYENFDKNWHSLKQKYSPRFYRMWKYYLLSSAGAFRSRKIQLWQIALTRQGLHQGFVPWRAGAWNQELREMTTH